MTQQLIGVGSAANDGTGDPLRAALQKVNANFTDVYGIAVNKTIVPSTAPAVLAAADSGKIYTNEGDTDGVALTLPTAVAGYEFTFIVKVAQTLSVIASAGDTIRIAGSVTAAAGSISSATVGNAITLVSINATEWMAVSTVGTWTI